MILFIMSLPSVSINIPISLSDNASEVLNSLKKIDYPNNLFEVIVIKGNHLTKQRNKGIKASKGDIIYLLDNDSQIQPQALQIIAREFSDKNIAAVGGPSLTPKNEKNNFSVVVGYILETYFGAFRMRLKWSSQAWDENISDYHFIGSNLALKKKYAKIVGGFDETFKANDETDLLRRLKDNGFKLKYTNKLIVYRPQRRNIRLLIKQFHHYGKGRMQHLLKNFKREDFFLLAPICFEFYLISLIFFHPWLYFVPLVLYILLGLATALKAAIKYKKVELLWKMTPLFPIIHLSYATGLLTDIISRLKFDKNRRITYQVKIIYYKKMGDDSDLP